MPVSARQFSSLLAASAAAATTSFALAADSPVSRAAPAAAPESSNQNTQIGLALHRCYRAQDDAVSANDDAAYFATYAPKFVYTDELGCAAGIDAIRDLHSSVQPYLPIPQQKTTILAVSVDASGRVATADTVERVQIEVGHNEDSWIDDVVTDVLARDEWTLSPGGVWLLARSYKIAQESRVAATHISPDAPKAAKQRAAAAQLTKPVSVPSAATQKAARAICRITAGMDDAAAKGETVREYSRALPEFTDISDTNNTFSKSDLADDKRSGARVFLLESSRLGVKWLRNFKLRAANASATFAARGDWILFASTGTFDIDTYDFQYRSRWINTQRGWRELGYGDIVRQEDWARQLIETNHPSFPAALHPASADLRTLAQLRPALQRLYATRDVVDSNLGFLCTPGADRLSMRALFASCASGFTAVDGARHTQSLQKYEAYLTDAADNQEIGNISADSEIDMASTICGIIVSGDTATALVEQHARIKEYVNKVVGSHVVSHALRLNTLARDKWLRTAGGWHEVSSEILTDRSRYDGKPYVENMNVLTPVYVPTPLPPPPPPLPIPPPPRLPPPPPNRDLGTY